MTDVPTRIYLDYQATTPADPRVVDAMLPFFSEKFGNPHSRDHVFGWEAEDAVELARQQIADLIGAEAREIIFTSGATESNNLAIKGAGRFYAGRKIHIVTLTTEHKCVLESCAALERDGYTVTHVPVDQDGLVDSSALEAAITDDTLLVSVMAVNNEIGVIQPMAEIGAICRARKVFLHTDAAQAFGKVPLDVNGMNIDLMSISGHKIYGPMGVGALYVRRRPRVRVEPLFDGGGQERGLRSGTLPAPLCVGLGKAAEIAKAEMAEEADRLTVLRDRFIQRLEQKIGHVPVNGSREHRIPGNLNITFDGVRSDDLMAELKDVAISSGSACSSAEIEPSYVLKGIGLTDAQARASIRIGFGRETTGGEVDAAADRFAAAVTALRERQAGETSPSAA